MARLARIGMNEEEAEKLSREFEAILGYVGEVKSIKPVSEAINKEDFVLKNVFREDAEPHASGIYTERILEQAPLREGNYLKVKKIL